MIYYSQRLHYLLKLIVFAIVFLLAMPLDLGLYDLEFVYFGKWVGFGWAWLIGYNKNKKITLLFNKLLVFF